MLGVISFATLALTISPATASPERRIVIHGSVKGSIVSLSVKRGHLVLKGRTARRVPAGCHLRRHPRTAICRLAGISSVELRMGPRGDLVQVERRLPVPLTVYLGPGSDKFVGGGEPDTCYPGGSRRNRCVGGGGSDVCITGPRNTDCVGGPGDDYCRARTGSDGCWGGPGRDVCVMGPGNDGCHGDGGDDRLYGGSGHDRLYGGRGHDYCNGRRGIGRSRGCDAGPRH